MSRAPVRRTDQIGPSSHQNQYCRGVLVSNWAEERLLDIERTQGKPPQIKMESTYQQSFISPAIKAAGASLAPPPLMRAPDAGQHLLLGHAAGDKAAATIAPKQVDALQKKQLRWKQERDPDFARHGVPQMVQSTFEPVRVKAPHFVQDFSDTPTLLRLRL